MLQYRNVKMMPISIMVAGLSKIQKIIYKFGPLRIHILLSECLNHSVYFLGDLRSACQHKRSILLRLSKISSISSLPESLFNGSQFANIKFKITASVKQEERN